MTCGSNRLCDTCPVYAGTGDDNVPIWMRLASAHFAARNPRSAVDSSRTAMVAT